MTTQIDLLGKMSTVLRVSTHIYGSCKEVDRKTFIFQVNLGMWPHKLFVSENRALSEGFNTHLWCFQGQRWENMNFSTKPRHVTPQIDHLGKNEPCSEGFNTHLWVFCDPQINHLRKTSSVLRVSTHFYGVSQDIDGKTFIFRVNLDMWPLKLLVLEKQALFWGFSHTCIMFPRT